MLMNILMNLACLDFFISLSFQRLQMVDQVGHRSFTMKNLEAAAHVAGMMRLMVFMIIEAEVKKRKKAMFLTFDR